MNEGELKSPNFQKRPMPKPVKWTGYESLRTEHATHLVIQSHGSELTFLFFEFQPPFTIGTPEEQATQMENLPHVEAKCVAKLVMSVANATQVSNVLKEKLEYFNSELQNAIKELKNQKENEMKS